ncbi:MAG: hypothetical protein WBW33_27575 [Bryobacteraceae bacterium]
MSLNVSEQTEAQIAEEARRQGITVDALLKRFIDEHSASVSAGYRTAPELPVWRLGVIGSLHRRDIYNDVP